MTDKGSQRGRRTLTWDRPDVDVETVLSMSGPELMKAMLDGRFPLPPVWGLVNFRLVEFSEGRAVMEMTPAEYHYNRFGAVQGGILSRSSTQRWVTRSIPRCPQAQVTRPWT